ncbi:hypothetical protein VTN96DRAFT_9485 [Rasamsonia emersonii]
MRSPAGLAGPLMAMLLVILSFLSTPVPAPLTTLKLPPAVKRDSLDTGGLTPAKVVQLFDSGVVLDVAEGQTQVLVVNGTGAQYIGSRQLDGCTIVVIAGGKAGIVGHYEPQTQGSGDVKAPGLLDAINAHKDDLQGGTGFVVAGTHNGTVDYKWQQDQLAALIKNQLGIDVKEPTYRMAADWEGKNAVDGPASVLLEYPAGGGSPMFYVEGMASGA